MVYIGIDLGGTGIKAGVVDEEGKILSKVSCPTGVERGHEAVIRDMAALAKKAVAEAHLDMAEVKSIGIGIPGIENPATHIVPFCTNLGWHDVPLVALMQKDIDKPVFVGNDATVAGLAEAVAGVSAGAQNSVFITLGTGVGGGVVLNGKPFSGSNGVGTEVGHIIVVAGGEPCSCGNRGCWERYTSATALIREGKKAAAAHPESLMATSVSGDLEAITAKTVIDCAKADDPQAVAIFKDYVEYLCVGLVNIINMFDPEVIAIGGGVSAAGEFLLTAIRAQLPKYIFYKAMPYARIELARLGNDAGIIGAAMLGR